MPMHPLKSSTEPTVKICMANNPRSSVCEYTRPVACIRGYQLTGLTYCQADRWKTGLIELLAADKNGLLFPCISRVSRYPYHKNLIIFKKAQKAKDVGT